MVFAVVLIFLLVVCILFFVLVGWWLGNGVRSQGGKGSWFFAGEIKLRQKFGLLGKFVDLNNDDNKLSLLFGFVSFEENYAVLKEDKLR